MKLSKRENMMDEDDRFDSFKEFQSAVQNYCTKNNVLYTITGSKTVTIENGKVREPYAEKLRYRYLRYGCKHGAKNKKKKIKGHGLRPNQR